MILNEKKIKSKDVYKSDFVKIYEDEVLLPNNMTSKRVYIKHPGAACALPILDDGRILLVKQYRYPVNLVTLELPAGKKDIGENSLITIKRELEEETGYRATDFEFVMSIHNAIAYSDEVIDCYIARGLKEVDQPLQPDDDEFTEIAIFSLDELKAMIKLNEITDVKTIIMIQNYLLKMEEL
ncbi:hypothetical protein CI105_03660 [Candidatus Izimaplasma bacterium ZiA1]|uniref:NUDIX domain-containing protein n=1 Tax=Candidatus Izimoplasma sp. ZiA1 TaxID=2024899 RepID=UPI000BAA7BD2|nr:hypothetical protein CI105_03660 [Candidatus Izimaplasma bacterium ZiA1]